MDVQSFTIDHNKLLRGIYVSRKDKTPSGDVLTTFDIRMKLPNREPVIDNPAIHTLEHLLAIYLRSPESKWADRMIYIGPMGCRTGIYFIVTGDVEPQEILAPLQNAFRYVMEFTGKVPAAEAVACGNYLDHNLDMARWEAEKFYKEVLSCIKSENMLYPE